MTGIRSPMNDNSEYLTHYGVLGMKWGIRKKRKSVKKASSKASSKGKTSSKKTTKKRIKDMSDEELVKMKNRLRLEEDVKNLTKQRESAARKVFRVGATRAGEKIVEEILHDTGKYLIGEKIINKYSGKTIVNIHPITKKKKDK